MDDYAAPGKLVEPRLRFEREIGRRRILEILRTVAHDGRIFEHGQQGKAWMEHIDSLNSQEIFQINGKGALKLGTAKEKFMEGLKAWKDEARRRMETGEPTPPETELDQLWRRVVALEAFHQEGLRSRASREETRMRNQEMVRQVLQQSPARQPEAGTSRKRNFGEHSGLTFDDLDLNLFEREEARAMTERRLCAEEKKAAAEETKAKADLMSAQARLLEKILEARQQGIPVPEEYVNRLFH
mmetsp:Transcript_19830/g.31048  ORF Transcript_19830/g.31048 Transcript_19830/m.31048 type:complete len:242 (-) Transcript_19830:235-960(-)